MDNLEAVCHLRELVESYVGPSWLDSPFNPRTRPVDRLRHTHSMLQGGDGSDTSSYSEASNRVAVHVDLDGATADDGSADDGPERGAGHHGRGRRKPHRDRPRRRTDRQRGANVIDGGTGNDQCTSTLLSQPVAPDAFTGCEITEIVPQRFGPVIVAGVRWRIKTCFKDAKTETGLDHYQVRCYDAWYRHITLTMLTYAFLAVAAATDPKAAWTWPPSAQARSGVCWRPGLSRRHRQPIALRCTVNNDARWVRCARESRTVPG